MSVGYGGSCKLYSQNEDVIIYEYYAYDLNKEECYNPNRECDGLIKIDKAAFIEPEIHQKVKRRGSGRKVLVTKRIERDVPISEYLANGKVELINSSYCGRIYNGVGYVGLRLIIKIFKEYQKDGNIPLTVSIHS